MQMNLIEVFCRAVGAFYVLKRGIPVGVPLLKNSYTVGAISLWRIASGI